MYVEDLAALDECDEKTVLSHIERRFNDGKYQTFVGEILITLNPNVEENIYTDEVIREQFPQFGRTVKLILILFSTMQDMP